VGEVIYLSDRLADRSRPSVGPSAFFYSLDCPISYLASERVDRALGDVEWIPVVGPLSASSGFGSADERLNLAYECLARAERDALALSVPLVEPQRYPMDCRRAARAAVWAGTQQRGSTFALAIARLAFCGGFDVASEAVIAEAAAVAGLSCDEALKAAGDRAYDHQLDQTSKGLESRGIVAPPAVRVGGRWFQGPDALISAVAFIACHTPDTQPQLPVS